METNKQHVQLPNDMTTELTPHDLLIYISIKRYMNKDTKEAFPSINTIASKSGASVPTVRKCIRNLEESGYIEVVKINSRKQKYRFLKYTNFEPFSYDFLDKEDISFLEKSYIIASQQYMFKENNTGKISMTDIDLAKKINMSNSTISRCNHSLSSKGYLDIVGCKQQGTGIVINEKFFHLDELGQAIVFTLQQHEKAIQKNTNDIEQIKSTVESLTKDIKILMKENERLKAALSKDIIL